jgi:Zn-dependent protease/CBS domain-containing protein
MTSTIRFGRIAGIEIGAHWTWLLVVGLVVWSLAAGVFPDTNPGLEPATYLAMALVAAALFFASLLAHELGHALAARRDGVPIAGITLWVFGGVARFSTEPPTAGSELRIALAGPAVSLVIGLAGLALAVGVALPAEIDAIAYWLGTMNLLLLVFNLIPAFPLDGGRVVRALLWQRTGDMVRATRWAAAAGRGFGAGFIAAGFVLAVFAGSLSGLWLALIGFFVMGAAEGELQLVEANRALAGLRVGDVTIRRPVTVQADLPLDRFFDDVFMRHRYTAYPVLADEAIGLMSFRDALAVPRERWPHTRVVDRMVPADRVLVLDADRPLADAFRDLATDRLHRALVRDGDAFAGLLSVTDAARVLEAAEHLPAYADSVLAAPAAPRRRVMRTA